MRVLRSAGEIVNAIVEAKLAKMKEQREEASKESPSNHEDVRNQHCLSVSFDDSGTDVEADTIWECIATEASNER